MEFERFCRISAGPHIFYIEQKVATMKYKKLLGISFTAIACLLVPGIMFAHSENVGPTQAVKLTGKIEPASITKSISVDAAPDQYGAYPTYLSAEGGVLDARYFVNAKYAFELYINEQPVVDYTLKTTEASPGVYHTTVQIVRQISSNYTCGPSIMSGGNDFTAVFDCFKLSRTSK